MRTIVRTMLVLLFAASSVAQNSPPKRDCGDLELAKKAGSSSKISTAMCHIMTGTSEDKATAFALLREEAKTNEKGALALSFALRAVPDVKFRDEVQAVALLEKLAASGSTRAKGDLGALLLRGQGVEQDVIRAEAMLNEAAKAGDSSATYTLFIEYRKGYFLPRDFGRSDALLERLKGMKGMEASLSIQAAEQILAHEKDDEQTLIQRAEAGQYMAQYYVGKRKLDAQQPEEAKMWFQRAADQKFPVAIKELAEMYERGLGVDKDSTEAARLYIQAAELGYVPAQIRLAAKYSSGEGVAKNPEYSLFWLKVAALTGSAKAAAQFLKESERVPSPLVLSATSKAEDYIKLHPEFLRQKDGLFREVRAFPAPSTPNN
jgi:TPR repeat protein